MKFALIGCGRIAKNHIQAALDNHLDIVALCDLVPHHINSLLERCALNKHDYIAHYTDHKEMLAQQSPDIVAIATESGCHAEIAMDCMRAGCHVIVEKPMALSLADAQAMIRLSQLSNRLLSVCHQNRFNQAIQHIYHAVQQDRFGKLSHGSIHVRWNRNRDYYRQAPWRGTWAHDGGVLMNQCIHGIDLLCWLMADSVQQVFAYTANRAHPYIECEDVGLAVLRFANGAVASIEGTSNVYPHNLEESLYLFGEKGTVKAGGTSTNTIEVWKFADARDDDNELVAGFSENVQNIYGNGHVALYSDVIEAIRENRQPFIDGHAGYHALELVLAIYQSAATGTPSMLPLTSCSTMDFA